MVERRLQVNDPYVYCVKEFHVLCYYAGLFVLIGVMFKIATAKWMK